MLKNNPVSKLRPWAKVLLALLAVVFFIALLLGINQPHFSPFTDSLDLNGITSCSNYSNGRVLIDSEPSRMIFTDDLGRIVRIVSADQSGSPADRFLDAHIVNDRVFVISAKAYNGGIYIASESVLEYDLNGNYIRELYRVNYGNDERRSFSQFRDIADIDGLLYLVCMSGSDLKVVVFDPSQSSAPLHDIQKSFPEPLSRTAFFPSNNTVVAKSITDNVYVWQFKDDSVSRLSPNTVRDYFRQAFGLDIISVFNLPENTDLLTDVVLTTSNPKSSENIACIKLPDNSLLIYDINSKTLDNIKSLPIHPWLLLTNLFFWISVVILSALVLFGLFLLLRKVWSARVRNLIIIAFVVLLIVMVLSYQQDQEIIQQHQDHVISISNMIALHLSKHHMDDLVKLNNKISSGSAITDEDSALLANLFDELSDISVSQKKENSFYACLYLVCSDGIVRILVDTQHFFPMGKNLMPFSDVEKNLMENSGLIRNESDNVIKLYRTFQPICDKNGKCVAIIEIGNYENNLSSILFQTATARAIALLAIIVTAFITYTTLRTFRGDVRRYHEQKLARIPTAGMNLNGIYSFIYALSTRMDYIILPILSLKMCQNTQMDAATTAFMAALPLTANGIGLWIGNILVVPLSRRLGEKGCAVLSQSLTIMLFLLEAFFAYISNIYLFTAAKLMFGIFSSGIMYSFRRTIPLGAPDLESRHRAMHSDNQAVISATVLSTLMGGFITQYISDYVAYLLAAALSVPLLFVCFYVFGSKKDSAPAKDEATCGAVHTKNQWGILLKPAMIALLCLVWLVKEFEFGYPTYLFPLYTDSAGLNTIMISSLSVLALTASSIVNRAAENYLKYKDRTKTMIVILMATAICMICFIFSPNIWWAIVTLFVVEIVDRITNVDVNIAFANVIIRYGYEPKTARAHVKVFEDGLQTASKPILSLFVPLGNNFACAAVGVVCAVLLGIYTWLDNHVFHHKTAEKETAQ